MILIYKAIIPFKSKKELRYGWATSSLMHGLIMEHIDTDYAEQIHSQQLRVFSQAVRFENGKNYWTITTLNDEAYEKIMLPLLSMSSGEVVQKDDTLFFESAEISNTSYEKLFTKHYIYSEPSRYIKLETLTPVAFKVDGRYINIPSPFLILSGIAKRFDKDCDIHETVYESLFADIERNISFSSFDLHSASFPVERVRIPAFQGAVTLRLSGNETFCRYINMISDYASFSGIGIKTALGMGEIRYLPQSLVKKEEIT